MEAFRCAQEMEIKTVFLPEGALIDKVGRLVGSIQTAGQPFDRTAARELYAYLIQPFEQYLKAEQILIIPQGPLVPLPFKALIDSRTGDYLIEKQAVSYAPSANFAARTLATSLPKVKKVATLFDEAIERITFEISGLRHIKQIEVSSERSNDLSRQLAMQRLGGHANIHVLLHGLFSENDPLQSRLKLNNPQLSRKDNEISV
jgi:CHAT domain-containing protein